MVVIKEYKKSFFSEWTVMNKLRIKINSSTAIFWIFSTYKSKYYYNNKQLFVFDNKNNIKIH